MALTFGRDHGELAWARFTSRLQANPKLKAYITAFFVPFNLFDAALQQLVTERTIAASVGAQLDGVGSIVGQKRIITNALYLAFFGYAGQTAGRGYGVAPYRRINETYTGSVTLSDEDYRTLIYLKIAINNGHGTIPEIIAACKSIFSTDNVTLSITGIGAITINIGKYVDPASELYAEALSFIPSAAGVAVTLKFEGTP